MLNHIREGDGGNYGGASSCGGRSSASADYGIPSGGDQFSDLEDDNGDLPF